VKVKRKVISFFIKLDKYLDRRLGNVSLPGFKGKSIYEVSKFFWRGLFQEDLSLIASSLAFNFFIAIFPLIIFIFTLIPYIPIDNFGEQITALLAIFLPSNAYAFMQETIDDIVNNQNAGLLSFGFIAALYFASTGFANMLSAFEVGIENKLRRSWVATRIKSTGILVLVISILMTTILVSLLFQYSIDYIEGRTDINDKFLTVVLIAVEYFLTILLVYLTFSSLYFFGSSRATKWRFFSAGSTLATILSMLTTYGFTKYVENFNSYNKLYGSVGTLLVLMILIFFNCFVVLIGFELNKSIDKAS
jgi:membrane protein